MMSTHIINVKMIVGLANVSFLDCLLYPEIISYNLYVKCNFSVMCSKLCGLICGKFVSF